MYVARLASSLSSVPSGLLLVAQDEFSFSCKALWNPSVHHHRPLAPFSQLSVISLASFFVLNTDV